MVLGFLSVSVSLSLSLDLHLLPLVDQTLLYGWNALLLLDLLFDLLNLWQHEWDQVSGCMSVCAQRKGRGRVEGLGFVQ